MKRELISAAAGSALTAALLLGARQLSPSVNSSRESGGASILANSSTAPTGERTDEAWRTANANLAEQVSRTEQKLATNEAEKKALERELKVAKTKLATDKNGGSPPKNEFDLNEDDWKELAKKGTVKSRYPCNFDPSWGFDAERQAALGISPTEALAIEKIVKAEEARIAKVILAGCTKVLGDASLAQKLGPQVCSTVVGTSVKDPNPDQRLVANIRAGNIPQPPAEKLDPLATIMLAETASMKSLEADLAGALGPAEAHRIVFADELGSCSGTAGPP